MKSGAYDGANRHDYFQGVRAARCPSSDVNSPHVSPGRAQREPGIHNHEPLFGKATSDTVLKHDRLEYGFRAHRFRAKWLRHFVARDAPE